MTGSAINGVRMHAVITFLMSVLLGVLNWNSDDPHRSALMYVYLLMGSGSMLTWRALEQMKEELDDMKKR